MKFTFYLLLILTLLMGILLTPNGILLFTDPETGAFSYEIVPYFLPMTILGALYLISGIFMLFKSRWYPYLIIFVNVCTILWQLYGMNESGSADWINIALTVFCGGMAYLAYSKISSVQSAS